MFVWVFAIALDDQGAFYYTADILLYSCSSITQMMICYIFWNLDNIIFVPLSASKENASEEVSTDDSIKVIKVELVKRNDSDFEFQLRMWQQFMREKSSSIHLDS